MDAAIGRGTIPRQDRDDSIAQATVRAYELALGTHGDYEHHLRFVLSRELNRATRSRDALDQSTSDVEEIAPERVAVPAEVDVEPVDLDARIARLPNGRYQALARLAYVERHTLGIISRRTGLSKRWLKQHLTIIARLLSRG